MRLNNTLLVFSITILLISCGQKEETNEIEKTDELNVQVLNLLNDSNRRSNGRRQLEDKKRFERYRDFSYHYYQLTNFKRDPRFVRYGFSQNNSHRSWLREVRKNIEREDSVLLHDLGLSYKELEALALAYALSNGKETVQTDEINKRYLAISNQVIKPRYQTALIDYQLDAPLDTTLSGVKRKIQDYKSRISALDALYNIYFTKRDSIAPFFWELCEPYFKLRAKLTELRRPKLDSIKKELFTVGTELSNNELFINTLLNEKVDTTILAFERTIAPIIHRPDELSGIYGIGGHLGPFAPSPDPVTKELAVLKQSNYPNEPFGDHLGSVFFIENFLDTVDSEQKEVYVYSDKMRYSTKVKTFGRHESECHNNFFYYGLTLDSTILKSENLLFSSSFALDLVYQSNPKIDSLLYANYPDICADCPSSFELQTTFAKLEGFDNLYFAYAYEDEKDTDELDTPIRALTYIKGDIIFYLWIESLDNFGCSCL